MIELILFAVVYLLSAILWWKYINIAHSKIGIYSHSSPKKDAMILMFFPLINSLLCLIGWLTYYPIKKKDTEKDYNSFFKIKK